MSRLDELLATVPAGRRAALTARLERFDRAELERVVRDGVDGGWVVLAWCRDGLAQLPRYGWSDARHLAIGAAARLFATSHANAPDAPWLWIELVAAIPNHKPQIAREVVAAMPETPATLAAIRRGLAELAIPHRRLLATRLRASGTLTSALAATWFADPTLRPIAEEYFRPGLEDHAELLRARLADATPGERESLVRLLRRLDPKLSLTGTHDATTDGELQARLREHPLDTVTAEVWADSLIDRHDPRGELIALELAILRAEPEHALELSRTQAALCATHRKALWNKPGGFPYREKFRGRRAIAFHSDWNHTMRGKRTSLVDRVQSFAEAVTTARAPRHVFVGRRYFPIEQASPLDDPSPLTVELAAALGGATVHADKHGAFVQRDAVEAPIADFDALRAVCIREPQLTLAYEFRLTWPSTGVALPHQEGEHYAGGRALDHHLQLYLADQKLQLSITFPFEREDDPRFLELYAAICDTLGRVMTPSQWVRLDPSADGKKLVGKRFRFAPG